MIPFARRIAHLTGTHRELLGEPDGVVTAVYTVAGECSSPPARTSTPTVRVRRRAGAGDRGPVQSHNWDASISLRLDAISTKYQRKGKTVEIVGLNDSSAEPHGLLAGALPRTTGLGVLSDGPGSRHVQDQWSAPIPCLFGPMGTDCLTTPHDPRGCLSGVLAGQAPFRQAATKLPGGQSRNKGSQVQVLPARPKISVDQAVQLADHQVYADSAVRGRSLWSFATLGNRGHEGSDWARFDSQRAATAFYCPQGLTEASPQVRSHFRPMRAVVRKDPRSRSTWLVCSR
jgi:hypothetical protein